MSCTTRTGLTAARWSFALAALAFFLTGMVVCFGPYHSQQSYNVVRHFIPPTRAVYEHDGHQLLFFDHDNAVQDIQVATSFLQKRPQPILFLHGHDGSVNQILNICSDLAHAAIPGKPSRGPVLCFVAKFREALSALHWSGISDQTHFSAESIRVIQDLYARNKLPIPHVSLIAHSLGGCVARNLIADANICAHISNVVNIGAPVNGHFGFVTHKMIDYTVFPTASTRNPCSVGIISLTNGYRDVVVPPSVNYVPDRWLPSTAMRDVYESYSHVNSLFAEPYIHAITRMYTWWPDVDKMLAAVKSPFAMVDTSLGADVTETECSGTECLVEYPVLTSLPLDLATIPTGEWIRVEGVQVIFTWNKQRAMPAAERSGGTDYDSYRKADCTRLDVVIHGKKVLPKIMNHPWRVCVYILSVDNAVNGTVSLRRNGAIFGQANHCAPQESRWPLPTTLHAQPCIVFSAITVLTPTDFVAPNSPHTKALILSYERERLRHLGMLGRTIVYPTTDAESDPQIVALRSTVPTIANAATFKEEKKSFTVVLNLRVDDKEPIIAKPNFMALVGMIVGSYTSAIITLAAGCFMLLSNEAPWWTYVLSLILLLALHDHISDIGQPVLPSPTALVILLLVGSGMGMLFHLVPQPPRVLPLMLSTQPKNVLGRMMLVLPAFVAPHVMMPVVIVYSILRGVPHFVLILMMLALLMHAPSLIFMITMDNKHAFVLFLDAFSPAICLPSVSAWVMTATNTDQVDRYVGIVGGIVAPLCFNRLHLLGYLLFALLILQSMPRSVSGVKMIQPYRGGRGVVEGLVRD
eukprot:GEMP01013316.1.p1 GENE.GEMP01013316.1~~GEMP01013316.1.p1  ORF type:complete len:807 (+),score=129.96 GEMP01013316.1:37-2457(+)